MIVGAQELTETRLCRQAGCPHELTSDDPTRGRHANLCRYCRNRTSISSWARHQARQIESAARS